MTDPQPIYTVRVSFFARQVVTAFGLSGLLDNLPRLEPGLYTVYLHNTGWDVAAAAIHPSGAWTLSFGDGREFGGQGQRESFFIV